MTLRPISGPGLSRAAIMLSFALASAAARAGTVYVSPVGDDANAGTAAAPKLTIQAGINAAGSGGVVVLAQGVYAGAGNAPWDLSGIPAGGSLTVEAAAGNPACVVDCGKLRLLRVPAASPINLTLTGLTVQNGLGTDAANGQGSGGAIWMGGDSTLAATDCVFRDNHTPGPSLTGGGAIWLDARNTPSSFVRCRFSSNSADSGDGGAIYANGAAFTGCVFDGNQCTGKGGAVCALGGCVYTDCRFTGNAAPDGGAVQIVPAGGGGTQFTRCLFRANRGKRGMALAFSAVQACSLTDCAIVNNAYDSFGQTESDGGAVYDALTRLNLTNCTIAGNTSAAANAGVRQNTGVYVFQSFVTLSNSILRVRDGDGAVRFLGTVFPFTVAYSDISGGWTGTGNIDADPQFVDPAAGDYRLLPSSPCIDAGSADYVAAGDADLDGRPRTFGAAPDMGAYELFVSNVSDQFTITRGAWIYNRSTGTYTQTLALTNAGADITTPVYLVFGGVTGGTVTNASGTTQHTSPAGAPYVTLAPSGLAHGATVTFTVTIHATSGPIAYTPLVYTGNGTP